MTSARPAIFLPTVQLLPLVKHGPSSMFPSQMFQYVTRCLEHYESLQNPPFFPSFFAPSYPSFDWSRRPYSKTRTKMAIGAEGNIQWVDVSLQSQHVKAVHEPLTLLRPRASAASPPSSSVRPNRVPDPSSRPKKLTDSDCSHNPHLPRLLHPRLPPVRLGRYPPAVRAAPLRPRPLPGPHRRRHLQPRDRLRLRPEAPTARLVRLVRRPGRRARRRRQVGPAPRPPPRPPRHAVDGALLPAGPAGRLRRRPPLPRRACPLQPRAAAWRLAGRRPRPGARGRPHLGPRREPLRPQHVEHDAAADRDLPRLRLRRGHGPAAAPLSHRRHPGHVRVFLLLRW